MPDVRWLFAGFGLLALTVGVLVGTGAFESDEPELSFDRGCDHAAPFRGEPPRGFAYEPVTSEQVDGMVASIESETGPTEFGPDDVEGRRVERSGRLAAIAWSMRAPEGATADQIAEGLTAPAEGTELRATSRETELGGRRATIVTLESGVARTSIAAALAGCRLILVQGSEAGHLRRVAAHLFAAD